MVRFTTLQSMRNVLIGTLWLGVIGRRLVVPNYMVRVPEFNLFKLPQQIK